MSVILWFLMFIPILVSEKVENIDRIIGGQKFTLTCPCKDISPAGVFKWFFQPFNDITSHVICTKPSGRSECVKSIPEKLDNIFDISTQTLIIDKASNKNAGVYMCLYLNNDFERHFFKVNILTPPGKPQIHTDSSLTEDFPVNLTCKSEGGNPTPILKWLWKDFSNNPISNIRRINSTLIQSNITFGTTILSTLWIPKSIEDGNSISCQAQNSVATISSNWMYLNINYRPIIFDLNPKVYYGLQGDEVNVECKATSKSPQTFKWLSEKGTLYSDGSYLIIKPLRTSDKGSYSCVVTNSYGTSSASLDIKVLSAPIINVPGTVIINEWETLNLTCDAVPPTANITWWLGNQLLSTTTTLQYKFIGKKSFEIQCKAYVSSKPYSHHPIITNNIKTVKVTVHYIPQKPTISANPADGLMTGSDVTLTCNPNKTNPGLPKPVYTWRKLYSNWFRNNTNFLTLSNLKYDNSGIYCCKLFNRLGSSEESCYPLNIEGQPIFKEYQSAFPTNVFIRIRRPFKIECNFQAQPHPTIHWYNTDGEITSSGNFTHFNVENRLTNNSWISSVLYIDKSSFDLEGKYFCIAENKYGKTSKEFVVKLLYPPIMLSNDYIKAANISDMLPYQKLVSLNCSIMASPIIQVLWIRKFPNFNEKIIENDTDKYFIKENNLLITNGIESILYIKNFQNDDYGTYMCYANNSEGHVATDFVIRKFGVPDPVHNLRFESKTCCSLTIKWDASFDGGFQQIFTVSYTANMRNHPMQIRTKYSNITLINLLPDVSYTVNISSSNQIGTGILTRSIEVKTELLIDRDQIFFVNKDEKTIEFNLPLNMSDLVFCFTIEHMDTQKDLIGEWALVGKCVKNDIRKVKIDNPYDRFRVKICLINYPDECTIPINQKIETNTVDILVSTKLIGTVAAICTGLVILLAILLFFILIRSKNFLPVITDLKVMKRSRKSSFSKDDSSNFNAKSTTPICPKKQSFFKESGGCPLLSTYSCDQVHMPSNPIEILNVCPPHNMFMEGLYSTLVKSSSISPFPYNLNQPELIHQSTMNNISSCCCHDDQQVFSMSLPASKSLKPDKIIYEVMV